jgi:hypothetical protein
LDKLGNVANPGERVVSVANNRHLNSEIYTLGNPMMMMMYTREVTFFDRGSLNTKDYQFYLYTDDESGGKTLFVPELLESGLHGAQLCRSFAATDMVLKLGPNLLWDPTIDIATYGYALTAHKAQGNEWENVYINADWMNPNADNVRWLYTAVSRARKKVRIKRGPYVLWENEFGGVNLPPGYYD